MPLPSSSGPVLFPLPQVTVAGFEPLLKFAYTSKLLFGKDNVVEIRNAASVLGFRDLDEACFEFLLPKFFSSNEGSAPFPRQTCCEKKCKAYLSKEDLGIISDYAMLDEKEVKPVADSPPQQEEAWLCGKSAHSQMGSQSSASCLPPTAEGANEPSMQCPKYRRQLACGLETCDTEKSLNNPVRDNCDPYCSAHSRKEAELEFKTIVDLTSRPAGQSEGGTDRQWKSEAHSETTEAGGGTGETDERRGNWSETDSDVDLDENAVRSSRSIVKTAQGERSPGLILHHFPKTVGGGLPVTGSLGHETYIDMDTTEEKKIRAPGETVLELSVHHKAEDRVEPESKGAGGAFGWLEGGKQAKTGSMEEEALVANHSRDRSFVEREAAEHLVGQLGSDAGFSQLGFQGPDAGGPSGAGRELRPLDWLNCHVSLSSAGAGCPFFQELDRGKCLWNGAELSECEGASQSGVSSINSGDDGDSETETEGDSESNAKEKARQVSSRPAIQNRSAVFLHIAAILGRQGGSVRSPTSRAAELFQIRDLAPGAGAGGARLGTGVNCMCLR